MNTTAIVTIVSNNYLHFARTLMQSVAQQHPQADRYCVMVDRDPAPATALSAEFKPLALAVLNLPDGDDLLFRYNILELNTAVKPWALAHLMQQGYQQVLYIDPDIELYNPMHEVFKLLAEGANVVLTPHLLSPILDKRYPAELDIRRAGTYNLGFCALANTPNSQAMLQWWQDKLRHHCIVAHDQGIFVDQSWIDLVPGLFDQVAVLRHPGYNFAYWNFAQRPVTLAPDQTAQQALVAGQPLVFMHFSGLDPLAPATVSKHQNRFTLTSIGQPLARLITDYCQRVIGNGIDHYRSLPYGFGCFDDGTPISDADRSHYRQSVEARSLAQGQPFACQQLHTQPKPPTAAERNSLPLRRVYAHFLGRSPDQSGAENYHKNSSRPARRALSVFMIGISPEARAKPGWFLRLLSWPLQGALLPAPGGSSVPPLGPPALAAPAVLLVPPSRRPAPYGGLHSPEPDSPSRGLWVAARLDLPVPATPHGSVTILGTVDLGLLAKAKASGDFRLEIHGPHGLLHRATLTASGAFTLRFSIPADALQGASQWSILASAFVVPKAAGIGLDTRELSWRVIRVQLDDSLLIDSSRSPVTQAIEQIVPVAGINLIGYLAAELGLGEGARSLARACVAAHIPYSAVDVGFQSQNLQRDTAVLTQAVPQRFAINLMYVNADQTASIANHLSAQGLQAPYRIGFWHWEQPQLPTSALGAFAHLDEVWVPSTFVHDAVAPFAPVPVVKIPHAIDFSASPGVSRSQFGLPADKLLVLVMYDFHSYQYRKNPQAALAAFRQAAARRSDVALVIKTINGQHHIAERDTLQASMADLPQVLFIDEFYTRQQTWDLQACCDILLSLHRAEGFGLAPAEMMHLGKPVIATGWSANTDFMTADNSCLVHYQLQALVQPVGVYPAGQLWAEADIDHAAWCLGRLLDDARLRASIGARAAADIRRQLSPQAVGALVRQRLSLLGLWQPPVRTWPDVA